MLQDFDYVFSENGLVAYKGGELLAVQVRRCAGGGAERAKRARVYAHVACGEGLPSLCGFGVQSS